MKSFLLKENYSSINLFNEINKLNENQITQIANGIDWTVNNYPNAVLIGGTALIYYLTKSRELTPDIDFLINDTSKLKNILDNQDILYKPLRGNQNNIMGISVEDFNTDYLDANSNNTTLNKLILSTYIVGKIGNYSVKIINPELLTILKLELGREKDINDGFALIKSGRLNKEKYLKYLETLKNSLQDYESLVSYGEMI